MSAKGLIQCLVLSLAVLGACSDDEDDVPGRPLGDAGEAAGGTGPEALAGAAAEQAGNGSLGGRATLEGGAAHSAAAAGASEAGMPPAEMGGAGGMPSDESGIERLSLCGRLLQKPILASRFALSFDRAVFKDPCIGWSTTLYELTQERDEYLSALSTWSHSFWGCKDVGVSSFALLWKQPGVLTAGDAKRFIDYYVLVLNAELNALDQAELSPNEVIEMRAALERLSKTLVTSPSLDYSHPECLIPPGGEGGAAGGGGADGAGGAAGGSAPIGGPGGEGGEATFPSAGRGGA